MVIGLACAATSCDSYLDITPDGQVKRDELLETNEGVEDAIYGVYAKLRSTSLYGQEMYFSALEIMSQTLWCYGNQSVTALGQYNYGNTSVKNVFASVWTDMYNNISNVNRDRTYCDRFSALVNRAYAVFIDGKASNLDRYPPLLVQNLFTAG